MSRKRNRKTGTAASHPFATLPGVAFAVGFFIGCGAMCPTCGKGTRRVSKQWAECPQCGKRVRRVPVAPA